MFFEFDAGAGGDLLVFAFASVMPVWSAQALPRIDALYFDADAALPVTIYLAPAAAAPQSDRITLVGTATLQHAARSCMPVWVNPSTRVPYELRIDRAAGAAIVRVEWSRNVSGGC